MHHPTSSRLSAWYRLQCGYNTWRRFAPRHPLTWLLSSHQRPSSPTSSRMCVEPCVGVYVPNGFSVFFCRILIVYCSPSMPISDHRNFFASETRNPQKHMNRNTRLVMLLFVSVSIICFNSARVNALLSGSGTLILSALPTSSKGFFRNRSHLTASFSIEEKITHFLLAVLGFRCSPLCCAPAFMV